MDPLSNCPLDHIRQLSDKLPDCSWERFNEQILGHGVKASVYQVCCRRRGQRVCNYVDKVIENQAGLADDLFEESIQKEVELHQAFEELGMAVPLVKAYYCPTHGGFLLMEKRDSTIEQYVIDGIQAQVSPQTLKQQVANVENQVKQFIRVAHQHLLAHDDLHTKNIMVNFNPQTWQITLVQLIDFGMSKRVASVALAEELENDTEIRLTFDRLRFAIDHPDQPMTAVKPKGLATVKKSKTKSARPASSPVLARRGLFDDEDMSPMSPIRPAKKGMFDSESPVPMKTPKAFDSPAKRRIMFDDEE